MLFHTSLDFTTHGIHRIQITGAIVFLWEAIKDLDGNLFIFSKRNGGTGHSEPEALMETTNKIVLIMDLSPGMYYNISCFT